MNRCITLFSSGLVPVLVLTLGLAGKAVAQCGQAGDCLEAHPTPGCIDVPCCTEVCNTNPLCCDQQWDVDCVTSANELCVGLCGAIASGDCRSPHPNPGCSDRECCNTVCAVDPFCCDDTWDLFCAARAVASCGGTGPGECGDPESGSCEEPHPAPACSDEACCSLVCAIDPSCCLESWDVFCVAVAVQYCVEACEPPCPPGSVAEAEDCGQDTNNPCYGTPSPEPSLQVLQEDVWGCGQLTSSPGGLSDIDVWTFTAVDPDGDGVVPVRLSLSSSFNGFAAIVPAPCGSIASAVASIESAFCVEFSSVLACVDPGEYRIVVAVGEFPEPSSGKLPCGQFGKTRYRVRVENLQSGCGPTCGKGAGSCYEPSKQPGCNDVDCCDSVCTTDPSCCEVQWDTECVQSALKLCATPPSNDECDGAADVTPDVPTEVTNIGATSSTPGFPADCGDTAGSDVWLRMVAIRTATCTVTTCGSGGFDTVLSVQESCGGTVIACDNDAPQCIPKTGSRITFDATCGATYLIRVGSIDGQAGTTTVRVLFGPGPGCSCPADLDGDGIVGGSDLTEVLSSWGGPGADLDGDGTTNASDLTVLLSAWGACP